MSRTPLTTVAVIHGDGSITQYRPGSDGVTVDVSVTGYNVPVDISLEFQSFGTSYLRHTVPLRDTLECLGLPDPYTPAALEVAWENAEKADKCHEGDVLITRQPLDGGFKITPAKSSGRLNPEVTRILAPSPCEPWADLADVLTLAEGDIGGLNVDAHKVAAFLHERGVRVAGDDDE